jgi:hypothetical protein
VETLSSNVTPKKRAEMAKRAEGAEGISVRLESRGNIHYTTAQNRKGKQDNRTPEQEARLKKRLTKELTPETKEQRKKLA